MSNIRVSIENNKLTEISTYARKWDEKKEKSFEFEEHYDVSFSTDKGLMLNGWSVRELIEKARQAQGWTDTPICDE